MNLNNLIVLSNSKLSNLGLGDYIRIISFLPNLKYNKLIWFSNKELSPLLKDIDLIDKKLNINDFDNNTSNNDLIINLFEKKQNKKNIFYLNNLFSLNKNIKENTKDLYKKLSKYFKIKKYKVYTNKKKVLEKDIDIFFNWIAPIDWKIKEYPYDKWIDLEKKISNKYNKIVWQNKNDKLDKYINKIIRSKLVISIVGLGNHISTFYSVPTVILSGPTFYEEATLHKKTKIIFPRNPCKFNTCNIIKDLNHCGRMDHILIDDIIRCLNKYD